MFGLCNSIYSLQNEHSNALFLIKLCWFFHASFKISLLASLMLVLRYISLKIVWATYIRTIQRILLLHESVRSRYS